MRTETRSMIQAASGRFAPAAALAVFYVALGFLARIVLWARFGSAADVPALDLPLLLLAGLANDAVESLYLLAPFVIYLLLIPDRWYRTSFQRGLLLAGTAITAGVLIYIAVAEIYFFEEFDARFNLVAVDYLAYPTEVFVDIWDAYPVVTALSAPRWRQPRSPGCCGGGGRPECTRPPRCERARCRSRHSPLRFSQSSPGIRPTRCPGRRTGSRTRSSRTATAASFALRRRTRSTTTPSMRRAIRARISTCSRARSSPAVDISRDLRRAGSTGAFRPARTVSDG